MAHHAGQCKGFNNGTQTWKEEPPTSQSLAHSQPATSLIAPGLAHMNHPFTTATEKAYK